MTVYRKSGPVRLQGLDITADRKWRYGVFTKAQTGTKWKLWATARTVPEGRRLLAAVPAGRDAVLLVAGHPAPGRDHTTVLATR